MKSKPSFTTLACPSWTVNEIIQHASQWNYAGIEFRVVLGELDLWKLPAFHGSGLFETRHALADRGLALPCIQSSARFDSPGHAERQKNLDNAERIAELAHELNAPAIRVFGDRVQLGCTHAQTSNQLAESLLELQQKLHPASIAVWLETHGDFSQAHNVAEILKKTNHKIQVIWDPANALEEFGESPTASETAFGSAIRHVHLKDFRAKKSGGYEYTLMGEGEMPLDQVQSVLERLDYQGFISFEWEKQWHPELVGPEIALPHFANWWQEQWLQ